MRHDAKGSSVGQKPKIEPELFRRTMGAFATGVTVVTVDASGATHAMTANAFMSGSFDPPLCVISIAKRAHSHRMIRQTLPRTQRGKLSVTLSGIFHGFQPIG